MDDSPATEQPPADKLDFKRILPIFVIVLVDLLGLTIIIPLLPYYAASFEANAFVIGLLGATYPAMQLLGAPILGRLSDSYGRKPILIISQIGTLVGFIMLGLASALPVLFLSRAIDGVSGGNISTAQAAITDMTTERNRTQGLGLIGAAFGLGFVIGPVIAFVSLAASGNNYHVPAWVAAAFSLVSIVLTAVWFKESLPVEQRGQHRNKPKFSLQALLRAVGHPTVGILLLLMFAQQLAFGGFEQMLSLFTISRLGLSAANSAVVFVYVGVIVVAVQGYFIGRWSRRLGDRRLIFTGLALLAGGLLLLAFTPPQPVPWYAEEELATELSGDRELPGELPPTQNVAIELPEDGNNGWLGLAWLLVAMIPLSIGGGILQPSINSLITKRVEPDEIGGMLGVSTSFYSGANVLAPIIGGALFAAVGPSAPFVAGGLLMGLLLLIAVRRIVPGREESAPEGLVRGGH